MLGLARPCTAQRFSSSVSPIRRMWKTAARSPAFKLLDLLVQRGAEVDYYDPLVPVIPEMRKYQEFAAKRSVGWNLAAFSAYDAALICTDHDDVDYGDLVAASRLVIDCRNATRSVVAGREKIVKA